MENVSLCLSRVTFGRKIFFPSVRLDFAKCFMKLSSTRFLSCTTCHKRGEDPEKMKIKTEDLTNENTLPIGSETHKPLTASVLPRSEASTNFMKGFLVPRKVIYKHTFGRTQSYNNIIYNPNSKSQTLPYQTSSISSRTPLHSKSFVYNIENNTQS